VKKTGLVILLAALGLAATAGQTVAPELLGPENRSVSASGQFTVFGGTRAQRSDLGRRADRLRDGLQRELGAPPGSGSPILLVLTPADAVRLRQARVFLQVFDAGEAGRRIEVNIAPGGEADLVAVDTTILRAVLLSWSLQTQQFSGDRFVDPPWWLVSAMSAAVAQGAAAPDASFYAALLEGKGMPRLDRFLRQNAASLRGRTRDLHAAQSLALYRMLTDLPGGRGAVVQNLTLAEPSRDPVERFGQTWPDLLAEPERAARLWALSVARLGASERLEFLSMEETAKRLGGLLQSLESEEPGEDAAAHLVALSRTGEGQFQLQEAATGLRQLGFRAHPLYGALVEEYRQMLDNLHRRKRRGFAAKFSEAEDVRLSLDIRNRDITDFLNWYQVNAVPTASAPGVRPVAAPEPPTRRNDAISRYLDSVEQRGW